MSNPQDITVSGLDNEYKVRDVMLGIFMPYLILFQMIGFLTKFVEKNYNVYEPPFNVIASFSAFFLCIPTCLALIILSERKAKLFWFTLATIPFATVLILNSVLYFCYPCSL